MATLGSDMLTLADWAKTRDPMGNTDSIVELLTLTNEIFQDAGVQEGNGELAHRTTMRTGLPAGAWRQINKGVPRTRSATAQVEDTYGRLETYAEVDKALVDHSNDPATFRMQEDAAHLAGLSNQMAETLFFGDTSVNPERFLGMLPRYDSRGAGNGANVLEYNTNTDANVKTSMWFVTWGPLTSFLTFPKNTKAGLDRTDMGEVTLFDDDDWSATARPGQLQGYRSHYAWRMGFCQRDWRYTVRLSNIPAVIDPDILVPKMVDAYNRIRDFSHGRTFIYCNRTVKTALDQYVLKGGFGATAIGSGSDQRRAGPIGLTKEDWAGQPTTMFLGLPIRRCESLSFSEDRTQA